MSVPHSEVSSRGRLLQSDLNEIQVNAESLLQGLQSAKVLITGGSGFVGTWLISALLEANAIYKLDLNIVALSRSRQRILDRANPKNGDPLSAIQGDIKDIDPHAMGLLGPFTHIIHGATSTQAIHPSADLTSMYQDAELGARNLIEVAKYSDKAPAFIHLSSGAVYGNSARSNASLLETFPLADESIASDVYGAIKIANERLVTEATNRGDIVGANPRLFAFQGPYLPLRDHFAIGNFVWEALQNQEVKILGNPHTTRSYMYPTDLIEWLLAVLVHPTLEPLHVGSEESLSMVEIATLVCEEFGGTLRSEGDSTIAPNHYVPSTARTRQLLTVDQRVSVREGLSRWNKWLKGSPDTLH